MRLCGAVKLRRHVLSTFYVIAARLRRRIDLNSLETVNSQDTQTILVNVSPLVSAIGCNALKHLGRSQQTAMTKTEESNGHLPGAEEHGEKHHWSQLAEQYWPKPVKTRKVKPEVVKKEIWDVLEQEAFQFRSLLVLENLQLLEKYVTPKYEWCLLTRTQLPVAWLYGGFDELPRAPDRAAGDDQETRESSIME